jgi:hypothetical protein
MAWYGKRKPERHPLDHGAIGSLWRALNKPVAERRSGAVLAESSTYNTVVAEPSVGPVMSKKSVTFGSYYSPARGGHAPGDIRDAFVEAVDAYGGWKAGQPEPMVDVREQRLTIRQVCGLLWNCSDCMPSDLFDQVFDFDDMPHGRSYSAGARFLAIQYDKTFQKRTGAVFQ